MSQGSVKRERPVPGAKAVFLLDTSGSMKGQEEKMVDATNTLITSLVKDVPDLSYDIYTFADYRYPVLQRRPDEEVKLITLDDYDCDGFTTLYDTLAKTIQEEENCTIVLATDGEDTDSHRFKLHDVQDMVHDAEEKKGITFKFIAEGLGAQETLRSISQRQEDVICTDAGLASVLVDPTFIQSCSQTFVTQNSIEF